MLLSFASPEERRAYAAKHSWRYVLGMTGNLLAYYVLGMFLLVMGFGLGFHPGFLLAYCLVGCCLFVVATWRHRQLSRRYLGLMLFAGLIWPFTVLEVTEHLVHRPSYRYYCVLDVLHYLWA